MSDRNREDDADGVWEFTPHWLTLVRPGLLALAGLALYKLGHDFVESRAGAVEIGRLLREFVEPALGAARIKQALEYAQPASIGVVAFVFGLPLLWALVVRATTILRVDGQQIIWQRGVFARDITQLEIGEVVGVNVYETFIGRILGFGTVDIETRGDDRLIANMIANARGFAGLVLDFKHRLAAR